MPTLYNPVSDNFITFKPSETPPLQLNFDVVKDPINIGDWASSAIYSDDGELQDIAVKDEEIPEPSYGQSNMFSGTQEDTMVVPTINTELQNNLSNQNSELEIQQKPKMNNNQKNTSSTLMNKLLDAAKKENLNLEPHMAAGILGNLMAESRFNSNTSVNDLGLTSGGLAQWRGSRLTELKNFAKSKGKPWTDIDVQVQFLIHELKNSHKGVYNKLLTSKNAEEASEAFAQFEGYAGWDNKLSSARTLQKSKKWSDEQTEKWIKQQHSSRAQNASEIYKTWSNRV